VNPLSAAYCAGRPEAGWTDPNPPNARELMQACWDHCPALDACAAWAASEPDFEGVAGGQFWRNGRPGGWPNRRSLRDTVAEWEHLRAFGFTDAQVAAELGIAVGSLRKALYRAGKAAA